ncbi:response regulator transcription factor [Paenibacillus sp. S150]|uniref:winged helix-turn-helix domain-containing protein n=1 Tax=Paenibacillus sp. S150 TaxID=2749826 RepID=UPI001C5850F8|nr:response regulator transcription factor [Paenibacillus sp. S150]MBW4080440.1 response regulator transcription factor [Paenibacillus sp. S150]
MRNETIAWFVPAQPADVRVGPEEGREREERLNLAEALQEMGLQTAMSEDLEDLRSLLSRVEPVLLLTELNRAAEWAGWGIISDLRERGSVLPVMVISNGAFGEEAVAVFKAGGNEYMVKPVHIGEFKCRVDNLLRLTGRRRGLSSRLKVDGLILDPTRRLVSRDGIELKMTPKEFDLLYYLAENLGDVCPRDEILKQVWGYHFHADTNVVDVYIRHLRLKVDKGHKNKLIHTVRGTGYVLRAPEGAPHADTIL